MATNKKKKIPFFWAIVFFLFLNSLSSSSGGLVFLFIVIFLCLFFYTAFFKARGNSFELSALIDSMGGKNVGSAVETDEDAVPSPWITPRNGGVVSVYDDFSRGRIVEDEWKKGEKNEDSDDYWRERLSKKTSGGIIFGGRERPQKRGRF